MIKSVVFEEFDNFLDKNEESSDEKQLLEKIEQGMQNGEFKMYLQFLVDNKTKKIASAEALSRWERNLGEVILPGNYIGLMEKTGLIVDFDYYMFETVCQKLAKWKGSEFDEISISCNITRITMSEKDFFDKIKAIADKYDFDRSRLMVEITEDSIEKNAEVVKNNIIKIKQLGFGVALDDIGSGYTSLISMCEYPVDVVKVDRAVLLLVDREMGRKLFLGIISLINDLNLKVVCEGVETEEQNALVADTKCDYIQGWYYSKALSEMMAEDYYREYMKKFLEEERETWCSR